MQPNSLHYIITTKTEHELFLNMQVIIGIKIMIKSMP